MTRTPGDLVRFRGEVAEEEEASAVVLLSSAARRSAAAALRGTAIGSEMVRGGDGGENGVFDGDSQKEGAEGGLVEILEVNLK